MGSFPAASATSSRNDCSAPAMKFERGALNAPIEMFEGIDQSSA